MSSRGREPWKISALRLRDFMKPAERKISAGETILERFQSCCARKDSPPGAAVPHDSRSTKHYGQRKFCGPAALGWVLDTIKLRVYQRRNRFRGEKSCRNTKGST